MGNAKKPQPTKSTEVSPLNPPKGDLATPENVAPETIQETNSQENISQTEPDVLSVILAKIEEVKNDLTELKTAVSALSQKPKTAVPANLKEYKPMEKTYKSNRK